MSFHKISGGDTLDPHSGRGHPLLHPFTAKPVAGRGGMRPAVGAQSLVSLNFSAMVAPLLYATGVSMGLPES